MALMHRFRRHLWDTESAPALRDNASASVTIHATLLCILLLTIQPSLMNINDMGVAAKDLLLKNKMRNFLCSRVIWEDTDVHATDHAPVITNISDNTTSLIRNLFIFLGLIQERQTVCQVRTHSNSTHCDPSRGCAYTLFSLINTRTEKEGPESAFLGRFVGSPGKHMD